MNIVVRRVFSFSAGSVTLSYLFHDCAHARTERSEIQSLSESQWTEFREKGFVKIGRTASPEEVALLKQRVYDIMMGSVQYGDQLLMQLDPGRETDYKSAKVSSTGQTTGWKGPTLNYRKIGEAGMGMEVDPLFRDFFSKPIFENICRKVYGAHASISIYRATIFTKPAETGGSKLPWHQDGGEHWALDRDPQLFVWTALVSVSKENGCVEAIPGSHKNGILSRSGHLLSAKAEEDICDPSKIAYLECEPGESYLCHNYLVHRSGLNCTEESRIGVTVNYMDGRTTVLDPKPHKSGLIGKPGQSFFRIFDPLFRYTSGDHE